MAGACVAEMTPGERVAVFAEDLVAMLRACIAEGRAIDAAIVATARKLRVALGELGADDVIAETAKRVAEKQAKRMQDLEAKLVAERARVADLLEERERERERHDGELVEAELRGERRADERFARAAGQHDVFVEFVERTRLRSLKAREGRFGTPRESWVNVTIKAGATFETLDFETLGDAARRIAELARERGCADAG